MAGWRKASMQRDLKRSRKLIKPWTRLQLQSGVTIAQVALNWVINFKGDIVVAIPAATKVQQAVDNAGAMKFRLSADEMSRLDEVYRADL